MRVHRQLITGMTGLSLLKLTYERLLTCRVQSSRYGTGRSTEALVGQELLERATEGIGSQGARHPHDNWYYRYARDTTARNVKDRIQESFSTKVILFFSCWIFIGNDCNTTKTFTSTNLYCYFHPVGIDLFTEVWKWNALYHVAQNDGRMTQAATVHSGNCDYFKTYHQWATI